MREDLPCDEPLPGLWTISLAPGGDIVDGGPCLEDFVILEALQRDCWRVRGRDDNAHVLLETRFVFPETLAVPDLGRLRELMLREGRLLDTLSHCCIVPLESGWLEQRADSYQAKGVYATCCRTLWSNTRTAEGAEETSASAEESGIGVGLLEGGDHERIYRGECSKEGRWRQPRILGTPGMSTTGAAATSCNGVCFPVESSHGGGQNGAATFLLRSWVPLTLEDAEVDAADDDDDVDQDEGGGLARNTRDDGVSGKKHYGGFEQLRWGGDDTTGWRGTAEPKPTANWTTSSMNAVGADGSLERKPPEPAVASDCCCSSAFRGQQESNDGGRGGFVSSSGERSLSLTSYLLLPDWLPLSVWFETEFEPRTTAQGRQDDGTTMEAVTTSGDWALVWRHLLSMFVQVVQGVEHLHTQGLIHNNICPSSVWVSTDGRCCVGNLSQAAPPGYRRPPPRATHGADRRAHFASPERRQGSRVGAKSDLYSLGVLMLEFWRNFTLSRGLDELGLAGIVEKINSTGEEIVQPGDGGGRLDAVLAKSMLAEEPFDRPDCFEVVDSLNGS